MVAISDRRDECRLTGRLVLGLLSLGVSVVCAAGALEAAGGDPQRGEPLFRRYCAVCHGSDGRGKGPNAPFLEDDQPRDLTDARYMGGLSDDHLQRVIDRGGPAIQGSRFMLPWGRTVSAAQAQDLVAYIRTLSAPTPGKPRASEGPPTGAAALVRELGCPTCHRIGDLEPMPVGPDLAAEGSRVQRVWLVRFLKQPHIIRPVGYHPLSRSQMPDFPLSEEEAASLTEYLLTLRDGILERWPEPSQMSGLVQEGRELFRQYACRACHSREGAGGRAGPDLEMVGQRLRPGWVLRFIQDPQAVDPLSPMPRLGVGEQAAWAITSYLFNASPQPESPPSAEAAAKGRVLFRALGCEGCHRVGGDEVRDRVAPDLSAAGDKLREEWVSAFLMRPSTIRPWLLARMPTFRLNEADTRALVQFISSLGDQAPPLDGRLRFAGTISEANVQAGRRLVSKEFLSCSSCHVGEAQREGTPEEGAPDLRISARRLKADWIVRWLQNPQRLAPGTKMPSFFPDETSGPEEILDGDEERQILALRDYILSLGGAGPPQPQDFAVRGR